MSISQDQAHALLEQHYDLLFEAVHSGYERYRKYPDRTIHRRSTRASIVNDIIIARVIEAFDEVPGTRFVQVKIANLRFMEVGGKVLLWFKKTDRLHRPQVYPTGHANRIESGAQLSMFPDLEILIVGYLLNRDETKVIRVSVSKPDGRAQQPRWFIDLDRPADVPNLAIMPPRSDSGSAGAAPAAPRVRVKLSDSQLGLFKK